MIDYVVTQGKGIDTGRAKKLAEKFGAELTDTLPDSPDAVYFLFERSGISFVCGGQTLKGDFAGMLPRVTGGHLDHEILLKAAKQVPSGSAPLRGVDCTAGLGEDAFLLAAKGYEMELFEHNPITAVLLHDAILRAKAAPATREIAQRMRFREGDSKELLATLSYQPDLIYLDPMFPEKKKSSETKKKLQVLHKIEEPCSDEEELLRAALSVHPRKVLIKRPADGPFLGGIKPSYSVTRTAVRFDCLVCDTGKKD